MPPFTGSATTRLHVAPGTWKLAAPTAAGFSVGSLGGGRVAGTIPILTAQAGSLRTAASTASLPCSASIESTPGRTHAAPGCRSWSYQRLGAA